MTDSEEISRKFYDALGMEGLSARTCAEWDEQIVASLDCMIASSEEILDVGCGYGRITIPLALKGYRVRGVDVSARLIREAQDLSAVRKADVEFEVGSMCELPYEDASFDVILALWSAFFELLEHSEQIRAIHSIYRVLRPSGWALFEGPVYALPTEDEIACRKRRGPDYRIEVEEVHGMLRPGFRHDSDTFGRLMRQARILRSECYVKDWGGRDRQFLRFWKP